mmetsp:Transcript_25827/g.59583  ORF Transcript_25827/g.59583 Transcript_25827/m.59583 type:complete len:283 (-) Transcript_25827:83-931(-)
MLGCLLEHGRTLELGVGVVNGVGGSSTNDIDGRIQDCSDLVQLNLRRSQCLLKNLARFLCLGSRSENKPLLVLIQLLAQCLDLGSKILVLFQMLASLFGCFLEFELQLLDARLCASQTITIDGQILALLLQLRLELVLVLFELGDVRGQLLIVRLRRSRSRLQLLLGCSQLLFERAYRLLCHLQSILGVVQLRLASSGLGAQFRHALLQLDGLLQRLLGTLFGLLCLSFSCIGCVLGERSSLGLGLLQSRSSLGGLGLSGLSLGFGLLQFLLGHHEMGGISA